MKTILLVEDDPFIAEVYSIKLKKQGYKVDAAKDCEMAMARLKDYMPDLLVLDINFGVGKMDGLELLKILRDDERTKALKTVVLSNYSEQYVSEHNDVDTKNLNIIGFFLKAQTSVDEMANEINKILN